MSTQINQEKARLLEYGEPLKHRDGMLYLTQHAYVDGRNDEPGYYTALAISESWMGSEHNCSHQIYWDIVCTDTDDESNACDWENPSRVVNLLDVPEL